LRKLLSGAGAAIAVKLVTGFAVAALAMTAAGAATEAAITGSLNPADWGQQVKHQVALCKAALTTGQHGIGACVSAFAKQHGDLVSDQHASGPRLNHGDGHGNGKANNDGKHNGNGNGKGKGGASGNAQPGHKRDSAPETGVTIQTEG
jgi:hypothetical protein